MIMLEPGYGLGVPIPWIPSGSASPILIRPDEKSSDYPELLDYLDYIIYFSASVVYY